MGAMAVIAKGPPSGILAAAFLLTVPVLRTATLMAQVTDFTIPPSGILPNYDRVTIGQREGLEGGAFVARTDDAGAGWYNPAGLALSEKSGLNASSNAYELTTITLEGIGEAQGSTRFSPSGTYFGAVLGAPVIKSPNMRLAFFYAKPVSWTPGTIDGAFSISSGGNDEQFTYTSTSNFTDHHSRTRGRLPGGEGAPPRGERGLGMTNLHQVQSVGDQLIAPGVSSTTATRSVSTDGSVYQVLLTGGVQWDAGSRIKVGANDHQPGAPDQRKQQAALFANRLFRSRLPRDRVPGRGRQTGLQDSGGANRRHRLPVRPLPGRR